MRLRASLLALTVPACGQCGLVDVEERTAQLAGDGATNCGTVSAGESITRARSCVLAAFDEGKAAYAVLELADPDQPIALGWAVSSEGVVFRLDLDSDPDGAVTLIAERCEEPSKRRGASDVSFFACTSETLQVEVCG